MAGVEDGGEKLDQMINAGTKGKMKADNVVGSLLFVCLFVFFLFTLILSPIT